jgi:hypothetical protein
MAGIVAIESGNATHQTVSTVLDLIFPVRPPRQKEIGALYDKISREYILPHAYAQCRKTAPWCEEIPLDTFYHDHHHGHRPHIPQRVRKGPIR